MGWNRQGVKLDAEAILREAQLIWPPRTERKDGFEHVHEHGHIRTLKAKIKQIPLNDRDYPALRAWVSEIGDDLKAWGTVSMAAHHHPTEWGKILTRIRSIRSKAGLT